MVRKNLLDEIFFRRTLDGNAQANHGRPPSRFFSQSCPTLYSSSHSCQTGSPVGRVFRRLREPSVSTTITLSSSKASTRRGDCVAAITCRSVPSARIIRATRSTADGCSPSSGSSTTSRQAAPPAGDSAESPAQRSGGSRPRSDGRRSSGGVPGAPAKKDPPVVLLDVERLEDGQNPGNLAADVLIPSQILVPQAMEDGGQVPPVAAEVRVVVDIPLLSERGGGRSVWNW